MAKVEASLQFVGDGRVKMERFLKGNVTFGILKEEVERATVKNMLIVQAELRNMILKKKIKPPNAPVTQAIKGEDFPLKDTGELVNAMETELKNSFTGFVGFLKSQKSSHGGEMERVLTILQEGATFKITPKMRRLLFAKIRESGRKPAGGDVESDSKGVIVIPPRPFMKLVFENKAIRNKINRNWNEATRNALRRVKAL